MEKKRTKQIRAVIFDWAGTTVDYGCMAPVDAFVKAFDEFGINLTINEVRAPMGLAKWKHIEEILKTKGLPHSKETVDNIYAAFEPALFNVLENHCSVIPGVIDTVAKLRNMNISIGSTTGYTKEMMNVVVPVADAFGYKPDSIVCPSDCSAGRPFPYMLWKNLENLGISSIEEVIKIGDTEADISEGKNAGCISIGVLRASSMAGLTQEEEFKLSDNEIRDTFDNARKKYIAAGADFVLNEICELPELIKFINNIEV